MRFPFLAALPILFPILGSARSTSIAGIGIQWAFRNHDKQLSFALTVDPSAGWVAIGFSDNGGMIGIDVCIAQKDVTGNWAVQDYWNDKEGRPQLDDVQNCKIESTRTLDSGEEIVNVRKDTRSCDEHDIDIGSGVVWMVAAWGPDELSYHQPENRGSSLIDLHGSGMANARKIKHTVSVTKTIDVTKETTQYWCTKKKLNLSEPLHIDAHSFVKATNLKLVHHTLVYICDPEGSCPDMEYDVPELCFDDEYGPRYFGESLMPWAAGIEKARFPEGVTQQLFDRGEHDVVYEVHIDNVFNKAFPQQTITTSWNNVDPAATQAGIIALNVMFDAIVLPPGQTTHLWAEGFVDQLADFLDGQPLTIFSLTGHMHLTGRKWELFVLREHKVMWHIGATYDFEMQTPKFVNNDLLPGDRIMMHWEFDTVGLTDTVTGGWGSDEEMAIIFVNAYPLSRPYVQVDFYVVANSPDGPFDPIPEVNDSHGCSICPDVGTMDWSGSYTDPSWGELSCKDTMKWCLTNDCLAAFGLDGGCESIQAYYATVSRCCQGTGEYVTRSQGGFVPVRGSPACVERMEREAAAETAATMDDSTNGIICELLNSDKTTCQTLGLGVCRWKRRSGCGYHKCNKLRDRETCELAAMNGNCEASYKGNGRKITFEKCLTKKKKN